MHILAHLIVYQLFPLCERVSVSVVVIFSSILIKSTRGSGFCVLTESDNIIVHEGFTVRHCLYVVLCVCIRACVCLGYIGTSVMQSYFVCVSSCIFINVSFLHACVTVRLAVIKLSGSRTVSLF